MTSSWGRYPKVTQRELRLDWGGELASLIDGEASILPVGALRSYGDVCLNDNGAVISTRGLNRFINFDSVSGVVRCEAGMLLGELLVFALRHGWFLPVSPGTQYVTLGGAIANDVHGKNHHRAGTFGCSVRAFGLARSDGRHLTCSREENADLFAATIGGLGLTGVILWADIQLKRAPGPWFDVETIKFGDLGEFLAIVQESDTKFEYTVAWIDCLARGVDFGRGLFMRGNHVASSDGEPPRFLPPRVHVPFELPGWVLNPISMKIFNSLYYARQRRPTVVSRTYYRPFFYPLDAIGEWNKIYGKRGFFQFQCVVPRLEGAPVLRAILDRLSRSGQSSFLAVIKEFGAVPSPGMLSFPRPGITLAVDVPNRGERTIALLRSLDSEVRSSGGAIYPAKDATMAPESFARYFPRFREFSTFIDARFSSTFWRRVTGASR